MKIRLVQAILQIVKFYDEKTDSIFSLWENMFIIIEEVYRN